MIRIRLMLTLLCTASLALRSNAQEPPVVANPGAPIVTSPATPVLTTPRAAPCCGEALKAHKAQKAAEGGQSNFKQKFLDFVSYHRCEPEGCPKPLGCSNPWTEFKFVFGSCSQYFGSAEATRGVLHKTQVPPPYRIPYYPQPAEPR
jgi:hypothetical protein